MSDPHQVEQDPFAYSAISDAQPPDRPGFADCIEYRAAAQHEIGTLAADAGIGGAPGEVEASKTGRDGRNLLEGQHTAIYQRAGVARQRQMDAGERRHGSGTA